MEKLFTWYIIQPGNESFRISLSIMVGIRFSMLLLFAKILQRMADKEQMGRFPVLFLFMQGDKVQYILLR